MTDDRSARISFAGDLDMFRTDEIASALPSPDGIDRLIIDLREATTIDSTVLSLLMRYRRSFAGAGKDPHEIVIIVQPQLRRIFEITGLIKTLTIVSAGSDLTVLGSKKEPLGEV